jgi:D-alanyl-D-alanine carboxypeptidase
MGIRPFKFWKLLGLFGLASAMALPAAQARTQPASYEDSVEFFQPFSDFTAEGVVTAEGIDPSLKGKGTWSYQFLYIARDGTATDLSQYRVKEKIKPASVLKLFTGWMAYQSEAQTVDYLHFMLRRRDNARADQTLKKMGGPSKLRSFYATQNLALTSANFNMVDGSGLSHSNRVTADLVTRLLTQIYVSGQYDSFKALLAEPQQDGTLSTRFKDLAYPLYAKTGTLADTASLAGYVDLNHGTLVFAIFSNQLKVSVATARRLIDKTVLKYISKAETL